MAVALLALLWLWLCLLPASQVEGSGWCTHVFVGHKATRWFLAEFPRYKEILLRHADAFQPGNPFPDWGWLKNEYRPYSDEAHDYLLPYYYEAAAYVRDTYPEPWDEETEKFVAFVFGGMAHTVEISWHGLLHFEDGLINVMSYIEGDDLGAGGHQHTVADTGGEFLISHDFDMSFLLDTWYLPVNDTLEVYYRRGYDYVDPDVFIQKNSLFFVGAQAIRLAGFLLYDWVYTQGITLQDNYLSYFAGGIDDMGRATSLCFSNVERWFENEPYGPICSYLEGDGNSSSSSSAASNRFFKRHEEEVRRIGERILDMDLIHFSTVRTERGVYFKLDETRLPSPEDLAEKLGFGFSAKHNTNNNNNNDVVDKEDKAECENVWRSSSISFSINSSDAYLGEAIAVGDINDDGIDDLMVGAPGWSREGDAQRGAVYVLFGGDEWAPSGPTHADYDVESEAHVTLLGLESGQRFGSSLAVVDVDRDGFLDLAVGAPTDGASELLWRGAVYIFRGPFSPGQPSSPSFVLGGSVDRQNFGMRLLASDFDDDGWEDLVVGNPLTAPDQRGSVDVFLSNPSFESNASPSYRFYGEEEYSWFGAALASVPSNLQGVGSTRLLVGAPYHRLDNVTKAVGAFYAFDASGTESYLYKITGVNITEQLGASLSVGAPFGDSRAYVALASPSRSVGVLQNGVVEVLALDSDYFASLKSVDRDQLDPTTIFVGDERSGSFAQSVLFSDVDGDGADDLLLGQPSRPPRSSGGVFLYAGGSSFPTGQIVDPEQASSLCWTENARQGRLGTRIATLNFSPASSQERQQVVFSAPRSNRVIPGGGVVVVQYYN